MQNVSAPARAIFLIIVSLFSCAALVIRGILVNRRAWQSSQQSWGTWLARWFSRAERVEVHEIDSSEVVWRKKSRAGRPALGIPNAERQRAYRQRRREEQDQPRRG
jgi:hypothetical protein